jgi:hypothetical protein
MNLGIGNNKVFNWIRLNTYLIVLKRSIKSNVNNNPIGIKKLGDSIEYILTENSYGHEMF